MLRSSVCSDPPGILLVDVCVAGTALGIVDQKPVPLAVTGDAVDFEPVTSLVDLGDLAVGCISAVQGAGCDLYPDGLDRPYLDAEASATPPSTALSSLSLSLFILRSSMMVLLSSVPISYSL